MDGTNSADLDAVRSVAVAYCEGLHTANVSTFEVLCDPNFSMNAIAGSGAPLAWDKSIFLDRVAGRDAFSGEPDYEILTIDVAGEMAHVKLQVSVPPRRYEDYLGFFRVNGEWKLITKLFRTIDGPALEG